MAQNGYGKNIFTPKTLFIYLVVGAIVYALIYYFAFAQKGTNYNYTTPSPTQGPTSKEMVVVLAAENNSGEKGTAVLTDAGGKTKVVVTVANPPQNVAQLAHIHVGACPTVGAVKYPLNNLLNGVSETILDVTISQLKAMLPLAINVHKSVVDAKTYVSCGDLK